MGIICQYDMPELAPVLEKRQVHTDVIKREYFVYTSLKKWSSLSFQGQKILGRSMKRCYQLQKSFTKSLEFHTELCCYQVETWEKFLQKHMILRFGWQDKTRIAR